MDLNVTESLRASYDRKGLREVIRRSVMAPLRPPEVMRYDLQVIHSINDKFLCLPRYVRKVPIAVRLPKPMEGLGLLQFSDLFIKQPVPPQAAGVVGGLKYIFYHSNILSITLSFCS